MMEVVAALIQKNGKFMICQRPADSSRGSLWEFSGGRVEAGETKERALIRECKEKIGIRISVGKERGDVVCNYPDVAVHLTLFDAQLIRGTPRTRCVSAISWITWKEVENFRFCPADKQLIKNVLAEEDNA